MTIPRVAFFGSPDFAVPTLTALIESPYRPCVVVTQPDRPAGRGRTPRPSPVKVAAEAAGIDVLQPARLRDPEATAALASFRPELQVIAAYGQILRPDVLALPRFGTLNVHASLLPRWRGASPVAAAILAGDAETGATIMLVNEGEDTGDILTARPEPIRSDDDAGSLSDRLAALGAALLLETIPAWLAGEIAPRPQDPSRATRARRLRKAQGRIDWTRPAAEIARQVRAFSPWPGATTRLRSDDVRIWRARPEGDAAAGMPGTVVAIGETIDVATGAGLLRVEQLQRAGKRAMDARAFALGERGLVGQRLGEPA
jgi:methionyl-tRNA formyltransferase